MAKPLETRPRLRILIGAAVAIGPGKADLLDAIARSGSISAAAREMGMSYRRAWKLVEAMNGDFRMPLVDAAVGGRGGGGARITDAGRDVVARYRAMEEKAAGCLEGEIDEFAALLAQDTEGKG